ncbi:MAG: GDSL family lipase, partial [Clostridia bacterium]|nr:GDSL family lipase [Clostridia bacterium]
MKKWLEKLKSGEKITIVAFGDSVTKGYFKSGDEFHSEKDEGAVYHQILGEKLRYISKNKNLEVINSGVGGETAGQGLKRFDRDVADKKPDLCIVCWGLNDVNGTVENYTTNPAEIFTRLKNMG